MRYLAAAPLFIAAHFGMGALIPATDGRSSWLVPIANSTQSWVPGLGRPGVVPAWLGIVAVACFGAALLGVFGRLVRGAWIRPVVVVGLTCLLVTYALYFTAWSLLPLCLCAAGLAALLTSTLPSRGLRGQIKAEA